LKTRPRAAKWSAAPLAAQARGALFYPQASRATVAKVSPGEFIRQVRIETGKVHWPTRKETVATGIMVMIMTLILALSFSASTPCSRRSSSNC